MDMKKKGLLLIVMILLLTHLKAQNNLISGYVITKKQDTIRGFLMDEIDLKLSKNVNFYHDVSGKVPIIYTSLEISEFGFSNGRTFKIIQQNNDSVSVFSKRIVTGKINMFVEREKRSGNFNVHLLRSDTAFSVKLSNPKKKLFNKDGRKYTHTDKKYIGLLSLITDSKIKSEQLNSVKYREKDLKKYIISYNSIFENDFPSNFYVEATKITYDIALGLSFNKKPGETSFQIGAYMNKALMEKSLHLSYRMGISYHYWNSNNKSSIKRNAHEEYKLQCLSIMPLGFIYHGKKKEIVPYGYAGIGLGLLMSSDFVIRNFEKKGISNKLSVLPVINCGVGLKIRHKSNFILVEITPPLKNGVFFNLGYSF